MTGTRSYSDQQIVYILALRARGLDWIPIAEEFEKRWPAGRDKKWDGPKMRYVHNKYKDYPE